jgi:ribosomal protein S21
MCTTQIHEDEPFEEAVRRFHMLVEAEYRRPWYKRRYGYYEKPSALKRKRRKMERHNKYNTLHTRVVCPIGLEEQFQRTGPVCTMGK